MTIDEAIEVLELHNQWRKGAEIPMETPIRIGMAIDLVVCELKNLRIANVSGTCSGCDWIDIDYKVRKCIKCNKTEQFD